MLRRLHPNGYDQVDGILEGLARSGWWLESGARVLDFGCGSGEHVYQFRERGFDAHGFDLFDTAKPRKPEDAHLFSFLERTRSNPADTRITDEEVRLPYETASFDLVLSLTVVEHCYALDGMMRECARVLKPGGVSLHIYPSRNQLLEPHFLVPFGGRIQSDRWLEFWAKLGVRHEGQLSMTPAEVARHNRFYLDTGLAYRPDAEVRRIASNHFTAADFIDKAYYRLDPLHRRLQTYWGAMRSGNALAQLAPMILCRVLLTSGPRTGEASA